MTYVMGFVTPIAAGDKAVFTDHAGRAAALMREFGATRVVDAWGDDVPAGKINDFAGAVQLKDGEVVGFGWMEFPDKATADAAGERMMSDPRMGDLGMPFDGKRMIWGGFEPLLETGAGGGAGYVDGYVLSVKPENRDAYRAMAESAGALFAEYGVTRIVEGWGVEVPHGEVTDFHRAAHARGGEVPVFSWCEWPDKETRDAGQKAMMADPRLEKMPDPMPFDGKRMIHGGFEIISDQGGK